MLKELLQAPPEARNSDLGWILSVRSRGPERGRPQKETTDFYHRQHSIMRRYSVGLVIAMLFGIVFVGACSGPPTLQTHSLSQAPAIDGTLADWGGALTRVGDHSVSMGAVSTDSTLYLALLIPDRAHIRSVAKRGLILWVDPAGKKRHTYGVRYPLGLRAQQASQSGDASASGASSSRSPTLNDLFPSDLAVIRNDTIRHRMPAGLSSDLRAQATLDTGSLIYEIAIPITPNGAGAGTDARRHGLHTPPGSALSIGLETPSPEDDSDLIGRSQGIPSVTGRSGRGRTRRGRRGRRGRRTAPSPSLDQAKLDLWTRVVVSSGQ